MPSDTRVSSKLDTRGSQVNLAKKGQLDTSICQEILAARDVEELGCHYKVVLRRRGWWVRSVITAEMALSQRLDRVTKLTTWIFQPLKPESQRMRISTMNFSNAINRRRMIYFIMFYCFLSLYSNILKLLKNLGAFSFNQKTLKSSNW